MSTAPFAQSPLEKVINASDLSSASFSHGNEMTDVVSQPIDHMELSEALEGQYYNEGRRPSFATTASDPADQEMLQATTFESIGSPSTAPSSFPQSPENVALTQIDDEDLKLTMVLAEEGNANIDPALLEPALHANAATYYRTLEDPTIGWTCAWGFTGKLDQPSAIPDTKADFEDAIALEKRAIVNIKAGLGSYVREIHSGTHYTFGHDFLSGEDAAFHTTIEQLDVLISHLDNVLTEVNDVRTPPADTVNEELRLAFGHVQPWVVRARAALKANHVFYKINYALCPREA